MLAVAQRLAAFEVLWIEADVAGSASVDGVLGAAQKHTAHPLPVSGADADSHSWLEIDCHDRAAGKAADVARLSAVFSPQIGYWRYISIYRHLQRNPDNQLYPLFEYFENWCQDENRHGDFFSAILKSQPQVCAKV